MTAAKGLTAFLCAVFVACTGFTASTRADDWPTYMHDNHRSGITTESLAPPLFLRWVFESPLPPAKGWAPPVNGYGARKSRPNVSHDDAFRVVAVGETAYFCSSSERKVYAVHAPTGRVNWEFFTSAPPRMAPVVWQGKLIFGADDGVLYCLDRSDGRELWRVEAAPTREQMLGQGNFCSLWPVRAGGIVDDGIAYFTAGLFPAEGIYFYAVNANDGSVRWRRRLDRGGHDAPSPQGHMLASAESVFMTSRVAPTRWNKEDGHPTGFNTPLPRVKDAAYRYHNGGSYAQIWRGTNIVYGQACMLGFAPDKEVVDKYGRILKGDRVFHWFNARQALFKDEFAYFATDYHVLKVEQDILPEISTNECRKFEETYKRMRVASYLTHMEEHDRLVRDCGKDNPRAEWIRTHPLKWGRELWEQWPEASREAFGRIARRCAWMEPIVAPDAMIMAGDTVFAGGVDRVVAIDTLTGKVLWTDPTGCRVRGLAVANGNLFVSTTDGNVRCYGSTRVEDDSVVEVRPPSELIPFPPDEFDALRAQTARRIAATTGKRRGYGLVVGGDAARMALELSTLTSLRMQALETNTSRVDEARQRLSAAGLHGDKVSVVAAPTASLPFPPYVFNLVVDSSAFLGGEAAYPARELLRVTKPCGGMLFTGQPRDFHPGLLEENGTEVEIDGAWAKVTRGRIPGARDWTHNYANAANTYCSEDRLVKGPFGILWYGDPGPRDRIERHASPPVPLVVDGIMFTLGYDRVMAHDVYNGVPYWDRLLLGATRTGLPLGTSNLVADDTSLFVVVEDRRCLRLDARTGRTLATYDPPQAEGGAHRWWGWIARDGHRLLGTVPEEDAWKKGRPSARTSRAVFALDGENGQPLWIYQGEGIDHDGIAVDNGKVFIIDRRLVREERERARHNTVRDAAVCDRKDPVDRKGRPVPPDLRKVVALDVATGRELWQQPFNATDITLDDTVVSGGAVGVACMHKNGVLVVHGTGSLGHPHREFLAGEFARRAIYAYDSEDGTFLWGGRKNYRKRPIIAGKTVYAEPFAWDVRTGEQQTVANPLSGADQVFDFHRGYIGCGHLLASGQALFGARGGMAYHNFGDRSGFTPFSNMQLSCGIGAVPAGGVFAAPEGRSGCTCATPVWTSIVLYPRRHARAWGIGVEGGMATPRNTPARHVSVNLGAPGYREDGHGNLWIPYAGRTPAESGIIKGWLPRYQHDETMFYTHGEDTLAISGAKRPWVFTSGYKHTKPLLFRLLENGYPPATYRVRLFFAEPENLAEGQRVFTVLLQGEVVLPDFDIVKAAGSPRTAVMREMTGIEVEKDLTIALQPSVSATQAPPLLCGFQAFME